MSDKLKILEEELRETKATLAKLLAEKNKLASTLNSIIDNAPGNLYWKNINGIYEGCNRNQLNLLQASSLEAITGKNIYEIWPYESDAAKRIDELDRSIMQNKIAKIMEETGGEQIYLSHKAPIFDTDGNVIGLMGMSLDITKQKKTERELQQTKIAFATQKFALTAREVDCIPLLLLGKTTPEIAEVLAVSPRTVESHVESLKNKLGCFKKSELIATLMRLGFVAAPLK